MASALHIRLLGTFQLTYQQQPLSTVNTTRLQSLLAYLVLHTATPQSRQYLAFLLWPDSSEAQARTNLRKLCFQLRQALPTPDHFLQMDNHTLQWRADAPYTLDLRELDQLFQQIQQNPLAPAPLARIAELYTGELLPGCYDDWIAPLRQKYQQGVQRALDQLVTLLEHQRAYEEGISYAKRLLQLDPLDETGYQRLMRLRALKGDRAGALRTYDDCVKILQQELGVEPSAATQAVYTHILRKEEAAPVVHANRSDTFPLVGRQQEWAVLRVAWQQASQGRAHFVTISGEAGIGKSRLAEELLVWVGRQGALAARAHAYAAEGALAYAPLTEWLRAPALQATLAQTEPIWLTELVRLLPELQHHHPTLPAPLPMCEGWQQQRFYEALARVLLAAPSPLLLVLEDLQWCDAETLAWLRYFLRFDPQARLLVVGTVRSEAVDDAHPLHELQRQLQRAGQYKALELTPLSVAETTTLAGHLTETDITGWTTQLYRETEGNPLFIVEMMRAGQWVGAGKALESEAMTLPPTVQAVIATRLAQLSPAARQVAQVAATIGRAFTVDVLAAASQAGEAALVQALDELWQRRLVREAGQGYDFSHDKIREVAYTALSPMRRRQIHQQIATALEGLYAQQSDAVAGQLATHYRLAQHPAKALGYLVRAGDHAQQLSAKQEALRYYGEALTLAPTAEDIYPILTKRARLHLDLYQGQPAVADFQRLLDRARQTGVRTQELQSLLGLLNAYYIVALDDQSTDAVHKVRVLYNTTQQLARELDDTRNLVRALLLPTWHFWPAMRGQNLRDTREAYALSCALGDEELIAESKLGLLINAPELEQAAIGDRFIPELQARHDLDRLNQAHCYLMWTHYHLGNFQRMVALCDAGIAVAAQLGMPPVVYPTLKAFALLNLGRYGAAWVSLQQEVADEAHLLGSVFKDTGIGMYLCAVGAYADAAAILDVVVERADRIHRGWLREWARLWMAHALIRCAKPGQPAWQRAGQTLAAVDLDVLQALTPWQTFWLVLQAEITLGEGQHDAALRFIQEAIAIFTANGYQGYLAAAWELEARILLQLQQPAAALTLVDQAWPLATALGYLALTWRIHATRAQTFTALAQPDHAAQAWQLAAALIQQLAATIDDQTLQRCFLADPPVVAVMKQQIATTDPLSASLVSP